MPDQPRPSPSELRLTAVLGAVAVLALALSVFGRDWGARQAQGPESEPPEYISAWQSVLGIGTPLGGNPAARIRIVVMYDIQCPACRTFHDTAESILDTHSDDLRIIYVNHPLDYHGLAEVGAHAAECARERGVFREWVRSVYDQHDSLGIKGWEAYAVDAGVSDTVQFRQCVEERKAVDAIEAALAFGDSIDLHGTPAVMVNGWLYRHTPSAAEILAAVRALTQGRDPARGARDLDLAPAVHPVPLFRIEGLTIPSAGLPNVSGAIIDASGKLFVMQPMDREIRVFDSFGEPVMSIGGTGQGPGEFSALAALGLIGDTLIAADPAAGGLSLFHPDGGFLRFRRWIGMMPPQRMGNGVVLTGAVPVAILPDDYGLMRPNSMGIQTPPRPGIHVDSMDVPLLRINAAGQVVDTVAWERVLGAIVGVMRGGQLHRRRVPFQRQRRTFILANGSGVVAVDESEGDTESSLVSVTRIGPSADTLFRRLYRARLRPVTDEVFRSAILNSDAVLGGAESPDIAWFESVMSGSALVPKSLPTVTDLVASQDGAIWLRREDDGSDQARWSILDGDGHLKALVTLPRSQRVLAARGDILVAVDEDPLGRATIVGYRVAWRSHGFERITGP